MNDRIKHLSDEAAKRPPENRIELIERLHASLAPVDQGIDAAWNDEAERRLDAYLAGDIAARDADEVLSKYLRP